MTLHLYVCACERTCILVRARMCVSVRGSREGGEGGVGEHARLCTLCVCVCVCVCVHACLCVTVSYSQLSEKLEQNL